MNAKQFFTGLTGRAHWRRIASGRAFLCFKSLGEVIAHEEPACHLDAIELIESAEGGEWCRVLALDHDDAIANYDVAKEQSDAAHSNYDVSKPCYDIEVEFVNSEFQHNFKEEFAVA